MWKKAFGKDLVLASWSVGNPERLNSEGRGTDYPVDTDLRQIT